MTSVSGIFNLLVFVILPYLVLVNFFLLTIVRYRRTPFTYSSLSSQFLENREQFWGSTAFHIGIVGVLVGHLIGFLIPAGVLAWNARPLRLYVLETTGLAVALLAFGGLVALLFRRFTVSKVRLVTSKADWAVLVVLVVQLVTGVYTAVFVPWGSSWFAGSAVPYLWSLFLFRPDPSYLATFPWCVKIHILNAWLFLGIFPYTRLVHLLVVPLPYLWRKPQVVRWYGIPSRGAAKTSSGR
jgi:nitrate reductase gamma subunit